jgi:pimeloyl-ACP methyl ester carboxylesterase
VPVSVDPSGSSEPTVADMEDVWIEHASPLSGRPIRLHALWHAHDDDDAPVLLYLHGARRDVEGSVFRIRQMSALGFSVLAIDYRGFGRSTDELPSRRPSMKMRAPHGTGSKNAPAAATATCSVTRSAARSRSSWRAR